MKDHTRDLVIRLNHMFEDKEDALYSGTSQAFHFNTTLGFNFVSVEQKSLTLMDLYGPERSEVIYINPMEIVTLVAKIHEDGCTLDTQLCAKRSRLK